MRIIRIEKTFPDSKWTKYLSAGAGIRAVHTEATSVAQELVDRHGVVGEAAQKLAEGVVAAVLNASLHDESEDINVRYEDSRTRLQAVIDARPEGAVRGVVMFKPDTAEAKDSFAVLFTQNRDGQAPYLGITGGHARKIDEHLDEYFRQSAQIATSSGIFVDVQGKRVVRAVGLLLQVIGGASIEDSEAVLNLERLKLRDLAVSFRADFGPSLIGSEFRAIEERELSTFCTCSLEKLENAVKMSGPSPEGEPETLEAVCEFCRTTYVIDTAKLWQNL
jgi:redox-regulated HSP33 family molecular chaperone